MIVEAVPKNEIQRVVVGNKLLEQHSSHTVRPRTVRKTHAQSVQYVACPCTVPVSRAEAPVRRNVGNRLPVISLNYRSLITPPPNTSIIGKKIGSHWSHNAPPLTPVPWDRPNSSVKLSGLLVT